MSSNDHQGISEHRVSSFQLRSAEKRMAHLSKLLVNMFLKGAAKNTTCYELLIGQNESFIDVFFLSSPVLSCVACWSLHHCDRSSTHQCYCLMPCETVMDGLLGRRQPCVVCVCVCVLVWCLVSPVFLLDV